MLYRDFFKRFIDVSASIFVLLILSPLLIISSLIIFIQDRGPVFFKQERIGKNQSKFMIYKFRSMPIGTANVSSDQVEKIKITLFGKFIRRTNIDELPQLINIIKGEMSLIGPRPGLPSQDELIKLRCNNSTYDVAPGLTGLAQIKAYDFMPIEEKAYWDGKYADSITFIGDCLIVLNTLLYLTKKPPVY